MVKKHILRQEKYCDCGNLAVVCVKYREKSFCQVCYRDYLYKPVRNVPIYDDNGELIGFKVEEVVDKLSLKQGEDI